MSVTNSYCLLGNICLETSFLCFISASLITFRKENQKLIQIKQKSPGESEARAENRVRELLWLLKFEVKMTEFKHILIYFSIAYESKRATKKIVLIFKEFF